MEKRITPVKMGHTWTNKALLEKKGGPHLEKRVKRVKMGQFLKKWVMVKGGHLLIKGLTLWKEVTLRKIGETDSGQRPELLGHKLNCTNGSFMEKPGSHWEKLITLAEKSNLSNRHIVRMFFSSLFFSVLTFYFYNSTMKYTT